MTLKKVEQRAETTLWAPFMLPWERKKVREREKKKQEKEAVGKQQTEE